MDDTFHEFSGATDTSPAYSNSDDMRSTTVSLQKRIAGKVSTAMIRGKNDRATHTPHWLGNIARLSYASVGQLRAWYDTEGCDIVKSVITSRNTKKAWLDYSLDFNLRNGLEKGFLLPSTMAGVIHTFGVRHINKLNFL